ncbi:hypothetical protein ZEAMMB73_Zm00001d017904 [Zea mays]|uniref:Uncharacterized protein n=1 Tax=Zea mays TaxID=4577 RepID=A0A1D6HJ22_MAIZE|nr:hypothetical protein ZEAMMB73_Zm00001d017904 [Zea mays]
MRAAYDQGHQSSCLHRWNYVCSVTSKDPVPSSSYCATGAEYHFTAVSTSLPIIQCSLATHTIDQCSVSSLHMVCFEYIT